MGNLPRVSLRLPKDIDWPRISELANVAVAHVSEAPVQHEWLRHRLEFDGSRTHCVAEEDGEVVGYAAVERRSQEPEATFRIFIVTSWSESLEVAEVLYEWAAAELANLTARRAWLREYASDQPLISFLRSRGFEVAEEYAHEGQQLVTLVKDLGASDLPEDLAG